MATAQEIRQAVDDKLATLWNAIQVREDSYAAAHNGRFWQGKRTHGTLPSDGAEVLPDIGTATPSDQTGAPWPAGIRATAMPMCLQIDCYDGALGVGYQATATVQIGVKTFARTAQVGPEVWRTQSWAEVFPNVP